MQPNDKLAFLAILNGLAAVKPGGKLPKEAYEIWWRAMQMQRWTLEEFRAAADHLATAVEFMPSPYHFDQLRKAGRPTAAEAWVDVMAIVRSGGYRRREPGRQHIVSALVDRAVAGIGGYEMIGMGESSKNHFLAKQFQEVFEDLQDAEDVREVLPQITAQEISRRGLNGPTKACDLLPASTRPAGRAS